MKQLLMIFILCFNYINAAETDILKARDDIKTIKLKLFSNEYPSLEVINELKSSLDNSSSLLTEKLNLFHTLVSAGKNRETLLAVINDFSDEFYKEYGEEIFNLIKEIESTRFILFTTSMSCECTILMCREYEAALYKVIDKKPDCTFAVIDTYSNETITDRFNVSFVPVLLIIDENGTELDRFVRDENISESLKNYLFIEEKI
jgi:hypothetical protein